MSLHFRHPASWALGLVLVTLSFQAFGLSGRSKDPLVRVWQTKLERKLNKLSDSARLDYKNTPWSDFIWPAHEGGVHNSWQLPKNESRAQSILLPKRREIAKWKSQESQPQRLKTLSPLVKFEIARGRLDYPLIHQERKRTLDVLEDREGLNYGWAVAATHLAEPTETTLPITSGADLQFDLHFGASDVKALIAYYYGIHARNEVKHYQVGSACMGDLQTDPNCKRIDPASFHIILTNMIGKESKSFVADFDLSAVKDHRPVVAYDSDIRLESDGLYRVMTTVEVVRHRDPQWQPYEIFNRDTEKFELEYTLELNSNGEIIRGDWLSANRPEFVWRSDLPAVDHEFTKLTEIYKPVEISL